MNNSQKLNIKYQKLRKMCRQYAEAVDKRKEYTKQGEAFCQWLIANNRCTKEEMKVFFKRVKK